jgi:hypothetical protein
MENDYGRKVYTVLKDKIKPNLNNPKDILRYMSQRSEYRIKGNTAWAANFTFKDIKYEHIVCVNNVFYRKIRDISGNSIELKEIVENNKIWYNYDQVNRMPSLIINCIDRANDIIVLGCTTTIKNHEGIITHGTGYRQLRDASYAPYNFYGNWFVYLDNENAITDGSDPDDRFYIKNNGTRDKKENIFGESITYLTSDNTNYFYTYNLNNEYKFFKLNENTSIDLTYLLLYIMYFDIAIGSYLNNTISEEFNTYANKLILFCDQYTIRVKDIISKYNYTEFKNNLDLTKPPVPFNSNWAVIKATNGDGDKPIAAKLCDTNSMDNTHLKIAGWYLEEQKHLMLCNPKDFLRNKNVYILISTKKKTKYFLKNLIDNFKTQNSIDNDKLICYTTLNVDDKLIIRVRNDYYTEFNKHFGNNIKIFKPQVSQLVPQIEQDIERDKSIIIDLYVDRIIDNIYNIYVDKLIKPFFKGIFIQSEFNKVLETKKEIIKASVLQLVNTYIDTKTYPRIQNNENDEQIKLDVNVIFNDAANDKLLTTLSNIIIKTINLMVDIGYKAGVIPDKSRESLLCEEIVKCSVFNKDDNNHMFNKIIYNFFNVLYGLEKNILDLNFDINYVDSLPDEYLKIGGYKQKYIKYKQKYLQLKKSLL